MANISSAEFQRNLGRYQDKALSEPVTITKNGRERLVLMSIDEYQRLKRRDRRVLAIDDFTDEQLAAIETARMPDKYKYLNEELKDWKP